MRVGDLYSGALYVPRPHCCAILIEVRRYVWIWNDPDPKTINRLPFEGPFIYPGRTRLGRPAMLFLERTRDYVKQDNTYNRYWFLCGGEEINLSMQSIKYLVPTDRVRPAKSRTKQMTLWVPGAAASPRATWINIKTKTKQP